MHWMKPLLPLVVALAVPACSFPCDKSGPPPSGPVQVVSGTGQLVLTCVSTKQTSQLTFQDQWTLSSFDHSEPQMRTFEITLRFTDQRQPGILNFSFDHQLEDGTYPLGKQSAVTTRLLDANILEGVVSVSRTRDVPFLDVAKPTPGSYESSVDLTFELKGQVHPSSAHLDCPEMVAVRVEPMTLHLEKTTTVGVCNAGDVLDGLGDAKGSGH